MPPEVSVYIGVQMIMVFRDKDGNYFCINTEQIEAILPTRGQSDIVMASGRHYTCTDSVQEVVKNIAIEVGMSK